LTQHFSFTFFAFATQFFPLWLCHQTSATELCYLQSSAFYKAPIFNAFELQHEFP